MQTAGQGVDVAGGWVHKTASLRRHGARVKTHSGECNRGDTIANRPHGYGRAQARRQMRPDDRPTSVVFLVSYRRRLKQPYLYCQVDAVA